MAKTIFHLFVLLLPLFVDAEFEVPKYMKDAIDILHKTCMAKSGATMDELSKCQSGQVPDHPTVKCYLACLYETLEVFDENDHVDLKLLSATMPDGIRTIVEHVGSVCAKIGGTDRCDTAFLTSKCYLDSHEDVIQFCHLIVF